MKKIMCFVEETDENFDAFAKKYEEEAIYLYEHFLSVCDNEVTSCFDEIEKEAVEKENFWLVTDNKSFYELVQKVFVDYFDKVFYLGGRKEKECDVLFDVYRHMDAELSLQSDGTIKYLLNRICELRFIEEDEKYELFAKELFENIKKNHNQIWWCHICASLLEIHEIEEQNGKYYLFLLSIMMQLDLDSKRTNQFLEAFMKKSKEQRDSGYYLWNQFKAFSLYGCVKKDSNSEKLLEEIYKRSYDKYLDAAKEKCEKIPYSERNHNLVFVFTIQFLENNHAPTKTVCERVKTLCKLGKQVVLVNTAEQYLAQGYFPCYNTRVGKVIEKFNSINKLQLDEWNVGFVQMPAKLPMEHRIDILLTLIKNAKPEYILSIGTGSMLADLCNNVIPTASMALAFSKLPHTIKSMRILGRTLEEKERKEYQHYDIIESRFTFELMPQKKHLSREELGIPKDKFVLVVVGIRLDYEIDKSFLDMLETVCRNGCYVVFAGKMEQYDDMIKTYPVLQENTSFIGYQDDILALMENIDLYINPKRLGGGFSVIEAFVKGKPGVYLKTGDVYVAGGRDFEVDNYEQMINEILHYKDDIIYYKEQSKKAKKRAAVMTDSVKAVKEIDEAIHRRILEKYW